MKRPTSSSVASAVTLVLLALSRPVSVHAQDAKTDALARRIEVLEARVAELQLRIRALEEPSMTANAPEKRSSTKADWRDLQNWRRLREGMTYEQVRGVLGEPERISGGTVAYWYCGSSASVTFISGDLKSWNEPR